MEYILFIHNNVDAPTTEDQWNDFFEAANKSGMFDGGSEITESHQLGSKVVTPSTKNIVGIMRFETSDVSKLNTLLSMHPVYLQGGTLELCKMPKT